jgi:hypothetical protein
MESHRSYDYGSTISVVSRVEDDLHARRDIWLEILGPTARSFHVRYKWTTTHGRHALVTTTYLLGLFDDFRALGIIDRTALACRIFGRQRVHSHIKTVIDVIRSWGFGRYKAKDVQWALCSVLLANKSPNLQRFDRGWFASRA